MRTAIISDILKLAAFKLPDLLVPLLVLPLLAKSYGLDVFGQYVYYQAVTMFSFGVVQFGFIYTAPKYLLKTQHLKAKLNSRITNLIVTQWTLAVISLILYSIIFFVFFKSDFILFYVALLQNIFFALVPIWYFQSCNRIGAIGLLNAVVKMLYVLGSIFLIAISASFVSVVLFICVTYFILYAYSIFYMRNSIELRLVRAKSVFFFLSENINTAVSNLIPTLYNNLSFIILGIFYSASLVGIATIASRFVDSINQALAILVQAASKVVATHKNMINFVIVISVLLCCLIILMYFSFNISIANYLFGTQDYTWVTSILIISTIPVAISYSIGNGYLANYRLGSVQRNVTVISALIGMSVALFTIPSFGLIGLVASLASARFSSGFMMLLYYLVKR